MLALLGSAQVCLAFLSILTPFFIKKELTLLSLTVLLVTSMVTTTSISGSSGHLELNMGFVMGLWMMWTVTAEVAWTSNDVAPLGVDLKQSMSCLSCCPRRTQIVKLGFLELKSSLSWVSGTKKPSPGDEMCRLNFTSIISVAWLSKQGSHWSSGTSVRG